MPTINKNTPAAKAKSPVAASISKPAKGTSPTLQPQNGDRTSISREAREPESDSSALMAALKHFQQRKEPSAEEQGKKSYEKLAFIASSGSFSVESRNSASEAMKTKPEHKASQRRCAAKIHAKWSKMLK